MTMKSSPLPPARLAGLAFTLTALATGLLLQAAPAQAIVVFDPSNYSQNVLTAARTLQQINNQIRSLQNEAQSLINQAKNLAVIDFPELQRLSRTLQTTTTLMREAEKIRFEIASLDHEFQHYYPERFKAALTLDEQVASARSRLDAEFASYRQTMRVQAQIVGNIEEDSATLDAIMDRSQASEGALQVGQATNQLLALAAKQQFQIQQLMAAQYRAQAVEQASRAQARADARVATTQFLGSGSAYTPD